MQRRQRVRHRLPLQRHLDEGKYAGVRSHSVQRGECLFFGLAMQSWVVGREHLRVRAYPVRCRLHLPRRHPLPCGVVARGHLRVRIRAVQRRVCVSGKHPMHRGYPGGQRSRLHHHVLQIRQRLRLWLLREWRLFRRPRDLPDPAGVIALGCCQRCRLLSLQSLLVGSTGHPIAATLTRSVVIGLTAS